MKNECLPLETVSAPTTINFTDIKNGTGISHITIRKSGRLCIGTIEIDISGLTTQQVVSSVTIPSDYRPMGSIDFSATAGGAGKSISGKIDSLGRFTIYIDSSLYNTSVNWFVANVCWFTAS